MNWDHPLRRVLVTGKTGSGKTTLALHLALAWKARWKFYFDPDREFSRKLDLPASFSVQQMVNYAEADVPVLFDPTCLFPGDRPAGFAFFCRWVLSVSRELHGAKLFCVDEIQKFTRPGPGGVPKSCQELFDEGRRQEIDSLIIAQRVNQVNDAIRGSLTEIVTFQHTDRLPLAWLEQDGFNPLEVSSLKEHAWIRRDLNRSEQSRGGRDVDPKRKRDR